MTASIPTSYLEHAAPASLRQYVECFWTRGAKATAGSEPPNDIDLVLPDGCIDVVLGYRETSPGEPPSLGLAVGTMTRPLAIPGTDPTAYLGVRFWPGRALPFLGVPASELTDLRIDLAEVWPDSDATLEGLPPGGVSELLTRFEAVLSRRLKDSPPLDKTVDGAVMAILRASGNISIASLAAALGVTRQHLARVFALHVGVPPKMFARVARVRRALAKARVATHIDWAALAIETGYYDQAHLAGEIRELTGRSPSAWLASA